MCSLHPHLPLSRDEDVLSEAASPLSLCLWLKAGAFAEETSQNRMGLGPLLSEAFQEGGVRRAGLRAVVKKLPGSREPTCFLRLRALCSGLWETDIISQTEVFIEACRSKKELPGEGQKVSLVEMAKQD